MMLRLYFLLLLFSIPLFSMHKAIIIFGPSCSGKSTLCRKIVRWLASDWQHIDRDVLIEENILNSQDLLGFAEHINKRLKEASIIADTNYYSQEFYDVIQAKQKIRILVYSPLEQLLNRDDMRAIKFKRSTEKNNRAREFVVSGYDSFFGFQNKFEIPFLENGNQLHTCYEYDLCVSGLEEDIEKIITQIKTLLKAVLL